jgi:glutathione S-transferase
MSHYRVLNAELASRAWVTGPMFGNADVVLAPAAMAYKLRGGPIREFPNVSKWLDACMARPSVKETATPVVKRGTQI